jgi:two-component system, chemotaxis family, CheB/CheR fusion protein
MTDQGDLDFENLLNYLNRSRGLDFTGYKRKSLKRLTTRRMRRVGVTTYNEYLDYLQVDPQEHNNLFNSLMLNVTAFFRDRPAWDCLSAEIIPQIISQKEEFDSIRLWSAGCASGEEAYSLAMLLAEALGIQQFCQRVKIYATDLDEEAIAKGRQALYTAQSIEAISPAWQSKYFENKGSHFVFRNDLRRCVIFGRHDLIHDAPISKLDLLCCRNTLMYFNAETQAKILDRFHFALKDHSFLFVGKAEMLLTQASLFTPINNKYRIFARVAKVSWRDRLMLMSEAGNLQASTMLTINLRLRDEVFETSPIAQIVLEEQGKIALINHQARSLFSLGIQNIGKPFCELELHHYIPRLQSAIEQACSERCCSAIDNVRIETRQDIANFFDIQITPLTEGESKILGVNLSFIDVTRYQNLRQELDHYSRELEAAQEELQTSNEELETTNEELQSTNEELETTNEELQNTNQELETMNEELQSSNEELQTTNEELNMRTNELNRVSVFMESILTSFKMGMTVLDNRLSIQLWNNRMIEFWGLRTEEVSDRFFFDLDIGLPVEQLRGMIRTCQAGESDYQELVLKAIDRRGKNIDCRVICTPLKMNDQQQGLILLMEIREEQER